MSDLTRRAFVAGSSALAVTPVTASLVRAQTVRAVNASWQAVADRTRALEQSRAILVYQNGREVLSAVFRGPSINRLVPIKSVSKTIVAALTGAAMDRGEIPDVTASLGDLAPQLIPRNADKRVGSITVEHLVTMQAGLERTSGPNYGGWVASRNWVSNALSRSFVREPGQGMLYSAGSFHVLGAVLSEVSGKSLLTLARERLGRPLGAEFPAWTR
ncbi:MAG: serine hydrolase, partial [Pseudomonadota bacterium]